MSVCMAMVKVQLPGLIGRSAARIANLRPGSSGHSLHVYGLLSAFALLNTLIVATLAPDVFAMGFPQLIAVLFPISTLDLSPGEPVVVVMFSLNPDA